MIPCASRITVYQDRAAWLADWQHGAPGYCIGASSVGAILGVSTWGGPWSVWLQHQPDAPERPTEQTEDQLRGLWWEPRIVDWYCEQAGSYATRQITRVAHEKAPWLRPSPDDMVRHPKDGWGVLEVKTQRYRDDWAQDGAVIERAGSAALEMVPAYYLTQAYTTLAATGLPWLDFVVMFSVADIRVIRVLADPVYQHRLVQMVADWRHKHLVGGQEPPYDHSAECRRYLTADPRDGIRDATDGEVALVHRYATAVKQRATAEKQRNTAFSLLAASMGESKSIKLPGGGRFTVTKNGRPRLSGLE